MRTTTSPTTKPAPDPNKITGIISAVTDTPLTLKTKSASVDITLTATTTYTIDGKAGTAADLKANMYGLAITSDGKTATEIKAYTPKPRP